MYGYCEWMLVVWLIVGCMCCFVELGFGNVVWVVMILGGWDGRMMGGVVCIG